MRATPALEVMLMWTSRAAQKAGRWFSRTTGRDAVRFRSFIRADRNSHGDHPEDSRRAVRTAGDVLLCSQHAHSGAPSQRDDALGSAERRPGLQVRLRDIHAVDRRWRGTCRRIWLRKRRQRCRRRSRRPRFVACPRARRASSPLVLVLVPNHWKWRPRACGTGQRAASQRTSLRCNLPCVSCHVDHHASPRCADEDG